MLVLFLSQYKSDSNRDVVRNASGILAIAAALSNHVANRSIQANGCCALINVMVCHALCFLSLSLLFLFSFQSNGCCCVLINIIVWMCALLLSASLFFFPFSTEPCAPRLPDHHVDFVTFFHQFYLVL
jgi:hypothetical protein